MKTKFQFRERHIRTNWELRALRKNLESHRKQRFDILKDKKVNDGLTAYQIQRLQFLDRKIANMSKLLHQ